MIKIVKKPLQKDFLKIYLKVYFLKEEIFYYFIFIQVRQRMGMKMMVFKDIIVPMSDKVFIFIKKYVYLVYNFLVNIS